MSQENHAWLPRQGKAKSTGESLSQAVIKIIAWLPVYTAIVVTATLYCIIFGVPFLEGA